MTRTATTPMTLADWLRAAYTEGAPCPPPESYHDLAAGLLTAEAAERLEDHSASCPACAAERELAELYFSAPADGMAASGDLARVIQRVERSLPLGLAGAGRSSVASAPAAPVAPLLPFPARTTSRRWLSPAAFRWAAAALLVLAAGLAYRGVRGPAAPALPAPEVGGVVRGAEVELEAPAGEVAALPGELRWSAYPGAAGYRIRLLAVDDSVLWEGRGTDSRIALPAEVLRGLHRAVEYGWAVEAVDGEGRRLAGSEVAHFRARPRL
jgi:hypothetical protein